MARKQYTVEELLLDKKARDSLPLPQFHAFVEKVIALTRGMGTNKIPATPADLAHKLSGGRWMHAPHLDYLSNRLVALYKRQIEGLIVSMPPRHGKSTLIDVNYPAWWLAQSPMDRIALAGYGESFARDWGGKVRDIVIEHGASVLNLELSRDKQAADDWALTTGGGMITVGVEGGLTGRGANLLIIDDPIKNEEEALSEVYRNRIWNWWQATASTRLEPNAVVLLVATRWHEDDLIGRLLRELPTRYEVVSFPALAGENDILGREPEEMLWPARFYDDPGYAKRRAKLSPYWWSSLYQQKPSPEGGGVLKEDWWQFYRPGDLPVDMDQWIQSWELSLKDNKTNDYGVGQVWGRKGSRNFLLAQVRDHFSLAGVCAAMKQFTHDYPKALAKLVEDTAMGPALKQTMQHSVAGIIPIIPKGSKRARAEAVVPLLQAGNVYLPGNSVDDCPKWVKEFIAECSSFPKGSHDDQVDTTTQALAFLQPSVWHHDAEAAEKAKMESMPELTPMLARKMMFQQHIDKMKKETDKRFAPRKRLRAMW